MILVSQQAITFLLTVFAGCVMTFIYDGIRIVRRIVPHRNIVINIEDFIYFVGCGVWFFVILFSDNYGEIRFFSIIGMFIGIILYLLTLSPLVVKSGTFILKKILRFLYYAVYTVLYPIRLLFRIILYPFIRAGRVVKKHSKRKLTKSRKWFIMKGRHIFRSIKVIIKKI